MERVSEEEQGKMKGLSTGSDTAAAAVQCSLMDGGFITSVRSISPIAEAKIGDWTVSPSAWIRAAIPPIAAPIAPEDAWSAMSGATTSAISGLLRQGWANLVQGNRQN